MWKNSVQLHSVKPFVPEPNLTVRHIYLSIYRKTAALYTTSNRILANKAAGICRTIGTRVLLTDTTERGSSQCDALILVLCYQQAACPEMFYEELICTAVLLDEEQKKSRKRKWEHESLLQRKEEGEYFM
jgi:hypothetical protein